MENSFIKVAAVTPDMQVANPAYNAEKIIERMKQACDSGARIIVFPELCITGYTCQDLFLQEHLLHKAEEALELIAEATVDCNSLVFVGLPLEKDGKLYNVTAALFEGNILCFVPKTYMPNYAEFYEIRHFAIPEDGVEYVDFRGEQIPFGKNILLDVDAVKGLCIGCEICEDVWVPDTPGTSHAMAGATVLVNTSASNENVGKSAYRDMLISATSARLVCGYIYANAGVGESTQDLVFGGHNIIAENGTILSRAKIFENDTIISELDIARIRHERRRMSTFGTKKSEYIHLSVPMRAEETVLTRRFERTPFVPADEAKRAVRCEEILSIQAYGLKKRYAHTGLSSAVVGVSGGLDSTLALIVCAKAFDLQGLDRSGIWAVTMPCFGTTGRTYNNACKLAKALGATLREVDIKASVTQHFADIGHEADNYNVVYENGQARERTQVLMDIANQTNGLVIGTGDMSELALGWATYNGDHMSMYGVNVGVPKTLVRYLVEYYALECRKDGQDELADILFDVLDTPVSPELLPPVDGEISQVTEDLVGPYELHDFYLYYMLRCGYGPRKVYRIAKTAFAGCYEDAVILKWLKVFYRRFFAQQFKRSCLPDGPKVGSVALSPRGDLRMPSDAMSTIWMQELDGLAE